MSNYTNKHLLGQIGENIVAHLEKAVASTDRYDTERDLTCADGVEIEVKTQNRHPRMNVFSINADKQTNREKCMNVDRLVFVEYDSSPVIRVWECGPRHNFQRYRTNSNLNMIGWPISEMTLLHEIEDAALSEKMRNLSQAKAFRK